MAPESATKSSSRFFSAGSLVEVSSDEEGFLGSWFSGTIVGRVGSEKCLVEYDKLFADEKGTMKLRETLMLLQLRPIPPPEIGREFKFGDEVDAFYNDGWWVGHITQVLGDGKFVVFFRESFEHIKFSKEKLRLHREWINEEWVPPFEPQPQQHLQQQPPSEQQLEEEVLLSPKMKSREAVIEMEVDEENFTIGKLVEVSTDEDCCEEAWFSATVVQIVGKDRFLVEYQTLHDDDSQLLKEEVDIMHIRPHPPEISVNGGFTLFDEVDAFYHDGWWVGMIWKILDNSRYKVKFTTINEEIEFEHSQLRLHQDWIDGRWRSV